MAEQSRPISLQFYNDVTDPPNFLYIKLCTCIYLPEDFPEVPLDAIEGVKIIIMAMMTLNFINLFYLI